MTPPSHFIIQTYFQHLNVKAKDAMVKNNARKGYSRKYYQDIIKARCLVIAQLNSYPEWSTHKICELFGFSRNTVIQSIKRGNEMIKRQYV